MRQSRVALLYFGFLASFEESLQVATSPCCYRDYPDVISANLSSDAWSHAPAVPQTADACYFVCVIGLSLGRRGFAVHTATGQLRLLGPGRTCFVASTRTGHANRPNTGN